MSDIIYQADQVTKAYNGRRVVDVNRLQVFKGEILAVVGPSGSGKSTLLRMLNFLEAPDQGTIHFHGMEFTPTSEMPLSLRRMVTMVFQRPMLLNRSVWDNVSFGLALRGMQSLDGNVHAALEQVGLATLGKERARTLSGGEAQRVALARAMVLHPEVLLLDEPTANLDPYNVGLIEEIIQNLNRQEGTTIVVVTHNIFQAERLAGRVAFLLDGKIVEVADNVDFFDHPSDPHTAAFVRGDMVY